MLVSGGFESCSGRGYVIVLRDVYKNRMLTILPVFTSPSKAVAHYDRSSDCELATSKSPTRY